MSSRRHGALDPIFERLMAKLVGDEPRGGYSKIQQIPELSIIELAAVLDHIAECCPEDFAKLIGADQLSDLASIMRCSLLTDFSRRAAIGELLEGVLQASARLWLVQYADEECQAENREGITDAEARHEAGVPDHELSPSEMRGVTYHE